MYISHNVMQLLGTITVLASKVNDVCVCVCCLSKGSTKCVGGGEFNIVKRS